MAFTNEYPGWVGVWVSPTGKAGSEGLLRDPDGAVVVVKGATEAEREADLKAQQANWPKKVKP